MSFGFSPSDIFTLVSLATKTYRGWKNACGDYADITSSLDSLLILLERIEIEAEQPHTALIKSRKDRDDLNDIISACHNTMKELSSIIAEYRSLGLGKSREKNWDRIRLGNKNLDSLKSKLVQHQSALSAYLNTIGLSSLTRIERDLHALPDKIQRTVDGLAAEIRAGRREGSIMTTYEDDEKGVWRQFRRELIGDGMKSSFVHKYKPQIRKYLRALAEQGLLEEAELLSKAEAEPQSSQSSVTNQHGSREDDGLLLETNGSPRSQEAAHVLPDVGQVLEPLSAVSVTIDDTSPSSQTSNDNPQHHGDAYVNDLSGNCVSVAISEAQQTKPPAEVSAVIPSISQGRLDSIGSSNPHQTTCETLNSSEGGEQDACPDDVLSKECDPRTSVEKAPSAQCNFDSLMPGRSTDPLPHSQSAELTGVSASEAQQLDPFDSGSRSISKSVSQALESPQVAVEESTEDAAQATEHKGGQNNNYGQTSRCDLDEIEEDWSSSEFEPVTDGGSISSSSSSSEYRYPRAPKPPQIVFEKVVEGHPNEPQQTVGPPASGDDGSTELPLPSEIVTELPKPIFTADALQHLSYQFYEFHDHFDVYNRITEREVERLLEADMIFSLPLYTWTEIDSISDYDRSVREHIQTINDSIGTYWVNEPEKGLMTWLRRPNNIITIDGKYYNASNFEDFLRRIKEKHVLDRRVGNYFVIFGSLTNEEISQVHGQKFHYGAPPDFTSNASGLWGAVNVRQVQSDAETTSIAWPTKVDAETEPFILPVEGLYECDWLTTTWFPRSTFNMLTMLALGRSIEQRFQHYLVRGAFTAKELEASKRMNSQILTDLKEEQKMSCLTIRHLHDAWCDTSLADNMLLSLWLSAKDFVWHVCGPVSKQYVYGWTAMSEGNKKAYWFGFAG